MKDYYLKALKDRFEKLAIQRGTFTLASGKTSSYYIDARPVLMDQVGVFNLGMTLYYQTVDLDFQRCGGMEVGAVPMTTTLLVNREYRHQPDARRPDGDKIGGFYVRKQAKDHGTGKLVEGTVILGDRVLILEDVTTTGGSTLRAIKAVEDLGGTVVRVISICDRLQGAKEALAKYDFRSIFTVRDFGIEPDAP